MNAAHLHLFFVHVPVIGVYFGLLLFLYSWAFKKNETMRVSFGVLTLVGIAAGVVFLTGEAAEEIVENVAGISEKLIEEHEGAAKLALILGIALGVSGLVGVIASLRVPVAPSWLKAAVLVFGLVATGALTRTAYLGGQINHPEIQDAQAQFSIEEHDD